MKHRKIEFLSDNAEVNDVLTSQMVRIPPRGVNGGLYDASACCSESSQRASVARRRPRSMRLAALGLVAAFASGSLAACSPTAEGVTTVTTTPHADLTTVNIAESDEYQSLSPLDLMFGLHGRLYDSVMTIASDGSVVPELAATEPTHNQDATEWTITLREDVTFTNGEPLNAQAVKATYEAIISPEYGSPLVTYFSDVKEIRVNSEYNLTFVLKSSYAEFPALLTVGIPEPSQLGTTYAESPLIKTPLGSGPYTLTEWKEGEYMTLAANEEYWDGAPEVKNLTIYMSPNEVSRAQRLQAGDYDGAQLSPRSALALEQNTDVEIVANPTADFRAISLPNNTVYFEDPTVRLALNYAVDRKAMVDGILSGYGYESYTPFSESLGDDFNPDAKFEFNQATAEQLLDQAGWTIGESGLREKDGTVFSFELMYFAEDTLRRDLAQAVASDLKKIGIEVRLLGVDRPTARVRLADTAFVLGGGDLPYSVDTQVASTVEGKFAEFNPNSPFSNPSHYSNPAVDELLEKARQNTDAAARASLYRDLQDELVANPPMINLVTLEHVYVARNLDAYDGLAPVLEPHEHGVTWGPWWNVEEWTLRDE